MAKARVRISDSLLNAPRSKWEHLIDEYIRDEDDRYIATRYYLDGICLIDIAAELSEDDGKMKSMSYMKRHKAKILNTLMKHIDEL